MSWKPEGVIHLSSTFLQLLLHLLLLLRLRGRLGSWIRDLSILHEPLRLCIWDIISRACHFELWDVVSCASLLRLVVSRSSPGLHRLVSQILHLTPAPADGRTLHEDRKPQRTGRRELLRLLLSEAYLYLLALDGSLHAVTDKNLFLYNGQHLFQTDLFQTRAGRRTAGSRNYEGQKLPSAKVALRPPICSSKKNSIRPKRCFRHDEAGHRP